MIKSGEDLDYIVDCLIENKPIKGVQENQGMPLARRRASLSPMGRSSYGGTGLGNRRPLTPTRTSRLNKPMFQKRTPQHFNVSSSIIQGRTSPGGGLSRSRYGGTGAA
jgi:hypothetical protein